MENFTSAFENLMRVVQNNPNMNMKIGNDGKVSVNYDPNVTMQKSMEAEQKASSQVGPTSLQGIMDPQTMQAIAGLQGKRMDRSEMLPQIINRMAMNQKLGNLYEAQTGRMESEPDWMTRAFVQGAMKERANKIQAEQEMANLVPIDLGGGMVRHISPNVAAQMGQAEALRSKQEQDKSESKIESRLEDAIKEIDKRFPISNYMTGTLFPENYKINAKAKAYAAKYKDQFPNHIDLYQKAIEAALGEFRQTSPGGSVSEESRYIGDTSIRPEDLLVTGTTEDGMPVDEVMDSNMEYLYNPKTNEWKVVPRGK